MLVYLTLAAVSAERVVRCWKASRYLERLVTLRRFWRSATYAATCSFFSPWPYTSQVPISLPPLSPRGQARINAPQSTVTGFNSKEWLSVNSNRECDSRACPATSFPTLHKEGKVSW